MAGVIGHTQPRRIAARAVAARIAEELKVPLGELVGYKLRFQDRSRPEGLIKLMTDGILLAETQGDRFLDHYDTIIVDEAHERSLNIDFLLGYLKWLMPQAARSEGDHHFGHHRHRTLFEAFQRCAHHQCIGPQLSGGGALPRGGARRGRRRDRFAGAGRHPGRSG